MKTKLSFLFILISTATLVLYGQTNQPPPLPATNAVPSTGILLMAQVAEMRTQMAGMAKLLAEQTEINAALIATLTNRPAPQTAPPPPSRPPYYWDGNRFVPVVLPSESGTATLSNFSFRNAPGRIVGVRVHPASPGAGYYADVVDDGVNRRLVYSLAPAPRGRW